MNKLDLHRNLVNDIHLDVCRLDLMRKMALESQDKFQLCDFADCLQPFIVGLFSHLEALELLIRETPLEDGSFN